MTFGLLIDWISHEYHTSLLDGIREFTGKKDIQLIVFEGGVIHSPKRFEGQRNTIFDLASPLRLDGVIISAGSIAHRSSQQLLLEYLKRFKNIPYVSAGREVENVPSIVIDNQSGIIGLTRHLIEKHKRRHFAFIQGPAESQESQIRYNTFLSVLHEAGIPFDPELTFAYAFWSNAGNDAVQYFMKQNKTIDAIVCANDDLAVGAMDELISMGIRVPEDVAITGFDNSTVSQLAIPSICTVHQPAFKIGYESAAALYRLIKGKKDPLLVTIPTQMIIRESCGCDLKSNPFMRLHYETNRSARSKAEYDAITYADEFEKKMSQVEQSLSRLNFYKLYNMFSQYLAANNKLFVTYFTQRLEELIPQADDQSKVNIARWIAAFWKDYSQRLVVEKQAEEMKRWSDNFHLSSLRDNLLLMSSIEQSLDEMAQHFSKLKLKSGFAMLYLDNSAISGKSEMIFAYNEKSIPLSAKDRQSFDARLILPEHFYRKLDQRDYLVFALHQSDFSFGYMIMEYIRGKENLYEELRRIISRNLRSAILFDEIQKANRELSQSETNLRSLTEATPLPLLLVDQNNETITYANNPFYQLFKVKPKEVLGMGIHSLDYVSRIYHQLKKMQSRENVKHLVKVDHQDKSIVSSYEFLTFRGVRSMMLWFFDVTERQELEREVLEISNREQRRIGQELHDDICQDLTGISAYAKALGFGLNKKGMDQEGENAFRISKLVNKTISKTQDLARGLFPPELGEKGLISSLNELARQIEEIHHIKTHFSFENHENLEETSLWLHLMRIAQEGINNAVKHGKPRNIWIYFLSSAEKVLLKIEDDGKGFTETKTPKGMGIRTMKYRAELMGAEININQRDQGGTELVCELKLTTKV